MAGKKFIFLFEGLVTHCISSSKLIDMEHLLKLIKAT